MNTSILSFAVRGYWGRRAVMILINTLYTSKGGMFPLKPDPTSSSTAAWSPTGWLVIAIKPKPCALPQGPSSTLRKIIQSMSLGSTTLRITNTPSLRLSVYATMRSWKGSLPKAPSACPWGKNLEKKSAHTYLQHISNLSKLTNIAFTSRPETSQCRCIFTG